MGIFSFILSAFKFRKKQTTQEKLQHIDEELERLEISARRNQQREKSAVLYLIIVSILIYSSSIFIFYLWYLPVQWSQRILYSVPFLLFPCFIFFLKRILHKIFINQSIKHDNLAKELKKDKKEMLENVMDTETYKVAKELLKKYDPHRRLVEKGEEQSKERLPPISVNNEGQELRRRNVPSVSSNVVKNTSIQSKHQGANGHPIAPVRIQKNVPVTNGAAPNVMPPVMVQGGPVRGAVRGPVPPAPILPRERSMFDKVCDFVIGDGPSNRFALICKQCYGHNGMILAEEYKFTSYRCCYCGFFNQAKMKRLNAPKLVNRQEIAKGTDSANSTDVESSTKSEHEEGMSVLDDKDESLDVSGNSAEHKGNEEADTELLVTDKEDSKESCSESPESLHLSDNSEESKDDAEADTEFLVINKESVKENCSEPSESLDVSKNSAEHKDEEEEETQFLVINKESVTENCPEPSESGS